MAEKKKRGPVIFPKPPTPHPDVGKTVWVNCRARRGCEGNQVVIVRHVKLHAGGTAIRYKCNSCGGSFTNVF